MAELTFIGTATVLLRFGPFTVLTDPNFLHRGQFAYLGKGIVSRRLTEPTPGIDDLPALDCIVLSHMHGDHWDRVAKRRLNRDTRILTTPKAARALHRQKFAGAEGLRTWQTAELEKDGHVLTLTAVPASHARGSARVLLPPVMGSVLEHREPNGALATRLYVTGDTLLIDDLRELPRRFPDLDVAVVHLGGTTLPGGLVVTMDGREGAELVELLRPRCVVPVHYDDYGVFKSPLSDFLEQVERRGLARLVRVVRRGATCAL
ncbi:MBL fold metallo-hydrolase [Streptomyces sp. NPDC005551]|uniref:MBL fold metallo-hydrolase n=1 Tax=unclassified Streptomyces TaxID=2593676 RepID=UPI003404D1AA